MKILYSESNSEICFLLDYFLPDHEGILLEMEQDKFVDRWCRKFEIKNGELVLVSDTHLSN